MALLQATSIEDYFSSSPVKKRKRSPGENNIQSTSNDPSSTAISSSSDPTTDSDRNNTANKSTRRAEYDEVPVSELKPGFRGVKVMVRVVNIFEQGMKGGGKGSTGNGVRGCLKILGKDGEGVILIHLYYADVPYDIGLGTLVTVWTPHVSRVRAAGEEVGASATAAATTAAGNRSEITAGSAAELMTSIFPERDGKCHVRIHRMKRDKGLCRAPVGGKGLAEVVSLGGFLQGGGGKGERVLVFVKALGEVVAYTNAKGKRTEKIDVGIEDESGEAILTLFGRMMYSALKEWVPSSTILLITRPNCWGVNSSRLSVSSRTMIEVDPQGPGLDEGVEWLRRLAGWSGRGVNERFPEEVFDVEAMEEAVTRVKFTLADIDDFARRGPKKQMFMGYVSVLLTEVNLVSVYKANRLYSAECCRVPLYGNTSVSICGQCGETVELRLNPQIIGAITDETGTISSSPSSPHLPQSSPRKSTPPISNNKKNRTPLLWSTEAWQQVLGQQPGEIGTWEMWKLQILESRLRFLRVALLFGWEEEKCGGRLAICRVVL